MPVEPVCTLRLTGRADPPCLERVHDLVGELSERVPDVDARDVIRFETAVIEVAGNIVEHGGSGVLLRLELVVHPDRVEAHFLDDGPPVDVEAALARVADPLAEQGRGLALARAVVDEVSYERTDSANRWLVLQHRSGPS